LASLRRIRHHSLKYEYGAQRTVLDFQPEHCDEYSTTKKRHRQWYKHSVLITTTPFQQPIKKMIEHDPNVIKEKGCRQIPNRMFFFVNQNKKSITASQA
jgi:hypothetical protein